VQNRAAALREFKARFQKTAPSHPFSPDQCASIADALLRLEVTQTYASKLLRHLTARLKALLDARNSNDIVTDEEVVNAAATTALAAVTLLPPKELPLDFLRSANHHFASHAACLSDKCLARAMCVLACTVAPINDAPGSW
jgi:hypothetical protein